MALSGVWGVSQREDAVAGATRPPTICLCMIVKNEVDVLGACFASCRDLIDHWVICDTGSTDGTQELIRREREGDETAAPSAQTAAPSGRPERPGRRSRPTSPTISPAPTSDRDRQRYQPHPDCPIVRMRGRGAARRLCM